MCFHSAYFSVESQTADLAEGTLEKLTPIASGMGFDLLAQPEGSPEQEDGVPGSAQLPFGHLLLPIEVEAMASGTSSENRGNDPELSEAPDRVQESSTHQEALLNMEQGTLFDKPDPQTSEDSMRLTSGLPAKAKADNNRKLCPR